MSFDRLPSELILEILHRLDSPKDLNAISTCHQRSHTLVQPILYSSLTQSGRKAIPLFLRTIIEKPQLAQHVKAFIGRVIPYMSQGTEDQGSQFWTQYHRSQVWNLLLEIGERDFEHIEETRRWYCAFFSHDSWDTATALLLRLLPNLERLAFTVYYDGHGVRVASPDFLNRALRKSAVQQRLYAQPRFSLAKLSNISIVNCDLRTVLPFFYLNSVNNLILDKISDADVSNDTTTGNDIVASIQRLSIKGLVPYVTVEKILRYLPNLTNLHYEYTQDALRESRYELVPLSIGTGISNLSHSLEELIITNLGESWSNTSKLADDIYSSKSLGSLQNFTKLRRIEAPAFVLLGKEKGLRDEHWDSRRRRYYTDKQNSEFVESLPASLYHLTIANCTLEILETVTVLFEGLRMERGLKTLREVDLVFFKTAPLGLTWMPWKWWDEEAKRVGVVLRRFVKST